MTENISVQDPFAALTVPLAPAVAPEPVHEPADATTLRGMSEAELCDEILGRIAAAEQRPLSEVAADIKHEDGTVAIDSMTAVSALASIGGTIGKPKLVDLSQEDSNDLRSIAGLARIARRALDDLPVVKS